MRLALIGVGVERFNIKIIRNRPKLTSIPEFCHCEEARGHNRKNHLKCPVLVSGLSFLVSPEMNNDTPDSGSGATSRGF